ncbi:MULTISPECIES: hypothetical protein [unclassified Aureimonas]|uniref:hypothetical protein n=1 Tax=unclassified Aureimonas TaxID=2615206 RepID=UPI0006FEE972|nr:MULTISPECIES: hypothetical protein [unclassified Aureimonas]KQT52463.1 hypothetical protein ASG62_14670 [Aureimonas sp. Leaf427]KQT77636.1 hypothetical protein ASG54_11740 [Aureimonas sp. Leaf460]
MSLPHSLTRHEWETLRHIALSAPPKVRPDAIVLGRLKGLDMVDEADGALHPTRLGRSAIVFGSPILWSR